MSDDLMDSILGELATPQGRPRIESMEEAPEEKEVRGRAVMATILGDKLGLGRPLSDDELKVALAIQERQRANRPRLIVDDNGIGLGQILDTAPPSQYVGEVEKYLLDKSAAGLEVGGDEFRTRMAMQRAEQATLQQQAPFARDVPPSIMGAMLGSQATVRTGAAPSLNSAIPRGEKIEVARWTGEDAETGPVTITLTPVENIRLSGGPPWPGTGGIGVRPIGIVQFGTSGWLQTVECDISSGVQFTVHGSAITVSVALDGGGTAFSAGALLSMRLAGLISFKPVFRTTPIYRTIFFDPLTATEQTITVPAFAKSVWFYRQNPASAAVTLDFCASTPTVTTDPRYTYLLAAGAQMTAPIPIAGDVTRMLITKTAGADSNACAIFELNL